MALHGQAGCRKVATTGPCRPLGRGTHILTASGPAPRSVDSSGYVFISSGGGMIRADRGAFSNFGQLGNTNLEWRSRCSLSGSC